MSHFIHASAVLFEGKVILQGEGIYIGANCTIGGPPEHKDIEPLKPESYSVVIITGPCRIMNGVNIDAGYVNPTEIEENTIIMAQAHIGHDTVVKKGAIVSSGSVLGGHTIVGEGANTGINSTTHQFTEIGEGTIIGAGCFAKGKLDAFSKYHTGTSAKNKGENTYAIERAKKLTPPDIII